MITNYDGAITTTPQVVAEPETAADLQAVLRDAKKYPGPVRPMGSYHSLTPCVSSPGTIVSMARMNRVLSIDTENMTVTLQAGIQHIRAAEVLRTRGLQFMLNVEIGNMTLGSAVCCHTKDALDCVEYGQICSYVVGMKWVTPTGELREASLENDPDLMYMLRSSYGLCGIIYEATLRVKPLEVIKLDYALHRLRDLSQADISDVIRANEAMVCWTIGSTVVIQTRNRTDVPRKAWLGHIRRKGWNFAGAFIGKGIRTYVGNRSLQEGLEDVWFALQRTTYRCSQALGGLSLYDPDKIVDYEETPPRARYAFTFWAFPVELWVENLNAYLEFAGDHYRITGFRCNMPLGSYYIKKDRKSVLSYSHEGDILSLDPIHAYGDVDYEQWMHFLARFNEWAHARGGIPLLNQSPLVERKHVVAAYGDRWEAFSRWVGEADPGKRMQNEFFAALLAASPL